MPTIKEQLAEAKALTEAGTRRRNKKAGSGFLSLTKAVYFFQFSVKEKYGYNSLLTQKERNMFNGFLKLCRSYDYTSDQIREIISETILYWDDLCLQKAVTNKGKEFKLNGTPNIKDFCWCYQWFLIKIEELKNRKQEFVQVPGYKNPLEDTIEYEDPLGVDMEYEDPFGDPI